MKPDTTTPAPEQQKDRANQRAIKLPGSLLYSPLWTLSANARVLFITLLALMDSERFIQTEGPPGDRIDFGKASGIEDEAALEAAFEELKKAYCVHEARQQISVCGLKITKPDVLTPNSDPHPLQEWKN